MLTTSPPAIRARTRRPFPSVGPARDDRLVVVSNRLPVTLDDDGDWRPSSGGLVSAVNPAIEGRDATWVGWTGTTGAVPKGRRLDGHLSPVELDADEVAGCYDGFANATIWPLYHDAIRAPRYESCWFDAYCRVNDRFAVAAARTAGYGAPVWVHDYHLQLVPQLLRARRPDLRIGYFHHIPFPHVDLLRQLPWRDLIVQGLLGADLIGFQTLQDATNFLDAVTSFGLGEVRGREVHLLGRVIEVDVFPVAVDVERFDTLARSHAVRDRMVELRSSFGEPRSILLGVDRLDYTKGIDARLRAVRDLCARGVLRAGEHVFVQVAVPSRGGVASYRDLRDEVERLVGEINGNYGEIGAPIVHYLHQSVEPEELVALYRIADVMVVTPYRDGMNLVAKEYVASRIDNTGELVLSEFAGAAAELDGARIVNPHDVDAIARTIEEAVQQPDPTEMARLRASLDGQSPAAWASSFLDRLRTPEVARWMIG